MTRNPNAWIWHTWYAWRPVFTRERVPRWGVIVERRRVLYTNPDAISRFAPRWEYRDIRRRGGEQWRAP